VLQRHLCANVWQCQAAGIECRGAEKHTVCFHEVVIDLVEALGLDRTTAIHADS
jgi:hypothetical protein